MSKRRAPTPRTMPTWDGRPETALAHLHDLEEFLRHGQIATWRESGASPEEIARLAPANEAQLRAVFDQWRTETEARLKLGAS